MDIKNLKLKLIIIFLIPAAGMIYFSSHYVFEKFSQYSAANFLGSSVEYTKSTSALIKELQKERGLSVAAIMGDDVDFRKELRKQRQITERAVKRFQKCLLHHDFIYEEKLIKDIVKELSMLGEIRKELDDGKIDLFTLIKKYSSIIEKLIESTDILSIRFINEEFFRYSISYKEILMIAEQLGKERALIAYLLKNGQKAEDIRAYLFKVESKMEELLSDFDKRSPVSVTVVFESNIPKDVKKRVDSIKQNLLQKGAVANIDAKEWWNLATNYLNSLYKTNTQILDKMVSLQKRIKIEAIKALTISLILWSASVAALYLLIYIISNLVESFARYIADVESQKRVHETFGEFAQVLTFENSKEVLLDSFLHILYKSGGFKHLWLIREQNDNFVTVGAYNLSRESLDENLKECEGFRQRIKQVLNKKGSLLSRIGCEGVFEEQKSGIYAITGSFAQKYVLVAVFKDENRTTLINDLINRMCKALVYALEKVEIKEKEERLKEELKLASYAFDTHEAITITDATGKIIKVNRAFEKITGYSEKEVIGKNPNILKSGLHDRDFYTKMWDKIRKEGYWKGEIYNRKKSGEIYPEFLSISAVKNEKGETTHYIAHFLDISDIKKAQAEVEYRAHHDPLTRIFNRQKFLEELERVYSLAKREGFYNAFFFIDIDNFKHINDYYNHEVGDRVLIEVAERIKSLARTHDIVARLAGDEFAFVACDLDKDKAEAMKKASIIAEKLRRLFEKPMELKEGRVEITFSIGIKIFPDSEAGYKDVIVNADIAMYHAKKNGKNQFRFFNEMLDFESKQFLIVKNEISKAIEEDQFILHYQPKLSVESDEVVGFEALVRWNHPKKGLIYPDKFLFATHGNRLIYELNELVLKKACMQINDWKKSYPEFDKKISINISGEQFNHNNFEDRVLQILRESDAEPRYLEFEIVEDALLLNIERTIRIINRFKELGITFSIDDFGTGYSSMNYLKRLPVDYLKIDREFLIDLQREKNKELVRMIVQTSHIFGLACVAEGVENEQTLSFLREIGCDYYQGYLFSKPLPPQEAARFLV